MENTCVEERCWFYVLIKELASSKDGVLEFKNCPFYQEMIFTPNPVGSTAGTAKLVKDCTCKRHLLFLLEQVYPRLIGVQQSNEEMRNSYSETKATVASFMDFIKHASDPKERPIVEMKKTVYAIPAPPSGETEGVTEANGDQ